MYKHEFSWLTDFLYREYIDRNDNIDEKNMIEEQDENEVVLKVEDYEVT